MASSEKYVTQQEAADLAGVSYDTIRRWRAAGKFPSARQRQDDLNGTWEIAFSDLVATGRCSSQTTEADVNERIGRTALERQLREMREQLVHAHARINSLEEISERQKSEVDFLRKLVKTAA